MRLAIPVSRWNLQIQEGYIVISYESAGRENVEEMKRLAAQGYGLNSFINRRIKYLYEK